METVEVTLIERVNAINAMMAETWEYDPSNYTPIEELFRGCVVVTKDAENDPRGECGSYKPDDTPYSLYRILFLFQPKAVDFSDMYKHHLFSFMSFDGQYIVDIELYKYELGLYFYAPMNQLDKSDISIVKGGWPGANNGVNCSDPVGIAFFNMIKAIVEFEHDVYSGNNFVV